MKKGGIYTDQKCEICGSNMEDNHRAAVACPNHPEQVAHRLIVRFGKLSKRHTNRQNPEVNYQKARMELEGWRYKTYEGTFDARDYKASAPLGFANLVQEYLKRKKTRVGSKHYRNLKNDLQKAIDVWGNRNVKDIKYPDLDDLLHPAEETDRLYGLSSKTRANVKSALHDFWTWLVKRQIIRFYEVPDFPEVSFELSYRNIVSKETQGRILDEIYRITKDANIRVWIGIRWLATYINVRPKELINIREGHINHDMGAILIPHPKEKEPKFIWLIDEDRELLQSMPQGLPELFFFRHVKGNGAAKPGQKFGHDYFYKWWMKACENLGIEGVDLYGGTRHSTAVYLREIGHSPEAIKRATMHSTNKAFDRYLRISGSEVRPIYQDARGSKKALSHDNAHPQKCKRNVNVISFTSNKKYELNQ